MRRERRTGRRTSSAAALFLMLSVGLLLVGCGTVVGDEAAAPPSPSRPPATLPATPEAAVVAPADEPAPEPVAARPEPRRSYLSVPRIGLEEMPVVRYRGTPDDAAGTEIQNTGIMASPRGSGGTVGPGEVGNYVVTGHRTSHGAPLADLPDVRDGDRIVVRSGPVEHVYRVTTTRITSFRSPRSLRQQSAAVPGRPGLAPTEAMLTLSTCRTPEDRAEGNYWSDEFGNPENRIDKIAVLQRSRPAER